MCTVSFSEVAKFDYWLKKDGSFSLLGISYPVNKFILWLVLYLFGACRLYLFFFFFWLRIRIIHFPNFELKKKIENDIFLL